MPIELCVCDIAGTTVRDNGFVARAFMVAASSIGLRPDDDWVRARMGIDKREVFGEMLRMAGREHSLVPRLAAMFEDAIEHELDTMPPEPLPGAADAIHSLADAGVKIAFTTGFSNRTAQAVIRRTPWECYPVIASDTVPRGRPAPYMIIAAMHATGVGSPSRVAVVGDTPSDLQAGRNAGCAVIVGVGHGSHTLDELRPHPHTHLVPDLSDLAEIIRGAL